MAQWFFSRLGEGSGGSYVVLNSNITHQVRVMGINSAIAHFVTATNASSAAGEEAASNYFYIRANGINGNNDIDICCTPSRTWFRGASTNAPQIICAAFIAETGDIV
jgi:hypothetical protein